MREARDLELMRSITKTPVGLSPDESAVLNELSNTLLLSRGGIEQRTGFSKDKVVRILNNLALRGLVAKEGAGRSRRYRRA